MKSSGRPFAALLGALDAQLDFGAAAIGGKDSMSGTFNDLDVPPTLISFAIAPIRAGEVLSPEFKEAGHPVYLFAPANGGAQSQREAWETFHQLCRAGRVCSAWAVEHGIAEGIMQMSFGNSIGFQAEGREIAWDLPCPGAIVAELTEDTDLLCAVRLGTTTAEPVLTTGADSVSIDELLSLNESVLEDVYPSRVPADPAPVPVLEAPAFSRAAPRTGTAKPKVLIPVFPGTNCEYDSARAALRAGLEPQILVLNNQTPDHVAASAARFAQAARSSQILFLPGGFSGGDEPDGSGKFITAFFRNPAVADATMELLKNRDGLCLGICTPSYLSKIEQGKAEPSPEVTELLLRRLGLVWTPEPESLEPCWKALLSGSPDFASCYERLVQPRQESLACSPLAADALLLAAFYEDELRPLPEEWEPFLSTRQLALQRALQGRWDEAVRLEPLPLLSSLHGKALYTKGAYTTAIEVLRDAYRSAADAGYPHMMLSCRILIGNCYSDLGRMEEMLAHFAVAERLAEALGDTDSLGSLRYNIAATQLELGRPEKALPYFSSLPHPSLLDLHKLAICHEQLGHREQALTAVQQAELLSSGEIERQMLALVRYRLEHPGYLHDSAYGTQLLDCFQHLRDTYPMGFTRFHLPWVLAWYKANRQYRQACRLLEEFPVK